MHKIRISIVTLTLLTLLLAACGEEQTTAQHGNDADAAAAPYIVTVNNPLRYFTSRLLGDQVAVRLLAPSGQDPAQWQPSVDDIAQLQGAELIILNGAGYSSWLDKISVSPRKLVNTSATLDDQLIARQQQTTHSHGPEGEHAHGDLAFTLWMDLTLAQGQAQAIAKALQRAFPQYDAMIASNLAALLTDLKTVDNGYLRWASSAADRRIIFSHPVYQYFERRYELQGISLHWEPNQMPSEEQWLDLQALIADTEHALLIWEGPPSTTIADRLRQIGVDYAIVNPGAGPEHPDWLALQQSNLASLNKNNTEVN